MRRELLGLCALGCLLGVGCGKAGNGDREYVYRYAATTGLPESIVAGGREIAIQFTPDSDPTQLASLRRLADSDRKTLISGDLSADVKVTKKAPNLPEPEPYQDFRLKSWRQVD